MKSFNHYLEIIQEGSQIKHKIYEITDENKENMLKEILQYVKENKKFKFEINFDKEDIIKELLENNNIQYDIMKITKNHKETSIFSPGQAIKEKSKDDNNFKFPFKGKRKFPGGSHVGRGQDEYGNEIRKMNPLNNKKPFRIG